MGDWDGSIKSYERALAFNPASVPATSGIANIFRTQEQFPQAVQFYKRLLQLDPGNGDTWGALGKLDRRVPAANPLTDSLARSLLSHVGRAAGGLRCLSTGFVPPERPQSIHAPLAFAPGPR